MLDSIIAAVKDAAAHNQFLSGGFLLMVGGFLLNWARKVPEAAKRAFLRKTTTTLTVNNDDPAFHWIEKWMAAQPFSQNVGLLSVSSTHGDGLSRASGLSNCGPSSESPPRPRILFSPGPGIHWFWHGGRFLVVSRNREGNSKPGDTVSKWVQETITLQLFGRDRALARRLFEEAMDFALPPEDRRLTVYGAWYDAWRQLSRNAFRDKESVILADGVMEDLLADVGEFLESERWYGARGLPYRRGYLLYGNPGGGKSTAITAVASRFRHNIAILNLGSAELDDQKLRGLFANLPERTFLVIEDVDRDLTTAQEDGQVATTSTNKLTFSAILNLLDGIGSSEGRILFMTTNHRGRLDPAMIRPGRVDREFAFGDATVEQARRLFLRFFEDRELEADAFGTAAGDQGVSMAALQGHLLRYRNDPDGAVANALDLLSAPQPFALTASAG